MFHVRSVFKVFLGKAPNCDIFYKCVWFFGGVNLKQIEEKTALESPGALSRNRKWYYFADKTIDKNCMTNRRN